MDFFHSSFGEGLTAHSFWIGAGALWLFSAAVSAMDSPQSQDSRFYGWLYRFTHLLAANLDRALGSLPFPETPPQFISKKHDTSIPTKGTK